MIRFNRNIFLSGRFFGSAKENPNAQKVAPYHGDKQIKDKLHIKDLDQGSLDTLYEHRKSRKTFSIYNFFSYLPNKVVLSLSKLSADPKVILRSQNSYLPKLTQNSVPIYDAVRSKFVFLLKSSQILAPILFFTSVNFYGPMVLSSLLFFSLYKTTYYELCKNFVIKMQLLPQTQQILIEKVGNFGVVKILRIKINDLQSYDASNLSTAFLRSTRSLIDKNLIFRVKSTNQLLMFDPEGVWYEEGINHQMLV